MLERQVLAELDHLFVGASQREVQEAERIEDGCGDSAKHSLSVATRDLGRARAVRMAAHAVDDDQQQRLVVRDDVDPILVLGPIAGQAQFGIFDAHEIPDRPPCPRPLDTFDASSGADCPTPLL